MKLVISAVSAVAAALVLSALPAAAAPVEVRPASPSIPKAVVKATNSAVAEGDRLTLRVRVPKAGRAKRVVLQERRIDVLGNPQWDDVDSKRARARLKFRHTVTATNESAYRVAVTYEGRVKPVLSRASRVTVWRWIPLREFAPYFETSGASYSQANLSGAAYATWGPYVWASSYRSWEARVTPGRNCTQFRAVLGLADTSDDGSTGTISFTADDALVYQSPTLTPGMTVPLALDLPTPYRFGMSAANTSADRVKAFPMVGNGEFYCTGIPA